MTTLSLLLKLMTIEFAPGVEGVALEMSRPSMTMSLTPLPLTAVVPPTMDVLFMPRPRTHTEPLAI